MQATFLSSRSPKRAFIHGHRPQARRAFTRWRTRFVCSLAICAVAVNSATPSSADTSPPAQELRTAAAKFLVIERQMKSFVEQCASLHANDKTADYFSRMSGVVWSSDHVEVFLAAHDILDGVPADERSRLLTEAEREESFAPPADTTELRRGCELMLGDMRRGAMKLETGEPDAYAVLRREYDRRPALKAEYTKSEMYTGCLKGRGNRGERDFAKGNRFCGCMRDALGTKFLQDELASLADAPSTTAFNLAFLSMPSSWSFFRAAMDCSEDRGF